MDIAVEGLLERNIRLYPWHSAFSSAYFWLPTFFLFFNSRVPVQDVLRLEAVYYFSVVLLEVPSGYFSDRCGRRKTLICSSSFFLCSYLLFFSSISFWSLVVAQVFLAGGIAFNSGTDTSFRFDSLVELGDEKSYGEREAKASSWSFFTSALSALVGGVIGTYDLRFPYLLSFLLAIPLLVIVLLFREPSRVKQTELFFLPQLRTCFSYLKRVELRCFFLFSVLMLVLNHVPYEFYQPYLRLLEKENWLTTRSVPAVSGFHSFLVMIIAFAAAKYSIQLRDFLSLPKLLLLSGGIQLVIISLMGMVLHPVIALIILFRSVPRALMTAPLNAAIAPLVSSEHRATYLSIQSLIGRLAFSLSLLLASFAMHSNKSTWLETRPILYIYSFFGLGILLFIGKTLISNRRAL